jgi:hypothetical protein
MDRTATVSRLLATAVDPEPEVTHVDQNMQCLLLSGRAPGSSTGVIATCGPLR